MQNIIVAVYSHPEYYPPTLNAIELLARVYRKVTIVSRNVFKTEWNYPSNAEVKTSGKYISIRDSELRPVIKKIRSFAQFTWLLFKEIKEKKPSIVLLYDAFPLLSYRIIYPFLRRKPILWYHNHDVSQPGITRQFSIGNLAEKNERTSFNKIDIFSLPSVDRKKFFPIETYQGNFFFLPNYPSIYFYNPFYLNKGKSNFSDKIRLIYQGSIATGHGLEQIIPLLKNEINGKQLQLVLKGFISEAYKMELAAIAQASDVLDRVIFFGVTPYQQVPKVASECHIGLGIHMSADRMNATLGTASNKIYEYASLGLPVIVYDNEQFRKHLGQYRWAFFTDCSKDSLLSNIRAIMLQYDDISKQANSDFINELNFEKYFNPVLKQVLSKE